MNNQKIIKSTKNRLINAYKPCFIRHAFSCIPVVAQWSNNPAINTAICTAPDNQNTTTSVSDGSGGAIITWLSTGSGANNEIYAQRVNASGVVQWTINGVPISLAASEKNNLSIISDSAGGAIIVWYRQKKFNRQGYLRSKNKRSWYSTMGY